MTCFEKNQQWGSCRLTCTPGIDPDDPVEFQTPWSCDVVGQSAPQYLQGHNGMYITAEMDGSVRADRAMAGTWERWVVVPADDGKVALLSYFGKYLCAEEDGEVTADRTELDGWEKFEIIHHGDDKISLRSIHGKYVVLEEGGMVKADRHDPQAWEKFTLQPAIQPTTLMSNVRETVSSFLRAGFTRAPQGVLSLLTAAGLLGSFLAVRRRRGSAVGTTDPVTLLREEHDRLLEPSKRVMIRAPHLGEA